MGLGARIFKYQILPGSVAQRLIFTVSGTVGAAIVDFAYRLFEKNLPWWSFLVAAIIFIAGGSASTANENGRAMTFGAANGIFIFLLIRWYILR